MRQPAARWSRSNWRLVGAVCVGLVMDLPAAAAPPSTAHTLQILQGTCAADMPAGFDWPADPIRLWQISGGIKSATLDIPGTIDLSAQRLHGWSLFAGITQPSATTAGAPPVFHTWYTTEEAFDATPGKRNCTQRVSSVKLTAPTQLVMEFNKPLKTLLRKSGAEVLPRFDPDPTQLRLTQTETLTAGDHDGVVAFSHVAFNKEMYDYLRDNTLYSRAALDQRIDPNVARKPLPPVPVRGVSLKFSWWPIASDRMTPLPVWDFDPRSPGDAKNPPETWKRVVAVDPVGNLPPPASLKLGGFVHNKPTVVGMDRFYWVRLSAADAQAAMADFRLAAAAKSALGRALQENDLMVMTAMHIATREFEPWVFTTFWWTDKPGVGPLASDMPSSVTGVYRNFVMDVSYNINNPKTPDGNAPVAYSPWLELFQLGGMRSQCMACHARAAYGPGVVPSFNPPSMLTKDPFGFQATPQSPNDPAFRNGTLSLERIWTIFTRAQ